MAMPSTEVQESSLRWEDDEDEHVVDVTPCEAVVIRNFLRRYHLVKITGA
ncbi:MAG TPA: hypothetical protein VF510_14585 [Ktedonobacterales bacterium]